MIMKRSTIWQPVEKDKLWFMIRYPIEGPLAEDNTFLGVTVTAGHASKRECVEAFLGTSEFKTVLPVQSIIKGSYRGKFDWDERKAKNLRPT